MEEPDLQDTDVVVQMRLVGENWVTRVIYGREVPFEQMWSLIANLMHNFAMVSSGGYEHTLEALVQKAMSHKNLAYEDNRGLFDD